jgi:stage II sporulation protein R
MDAVHAVVPEEGKKDLKRVLDEETYDMVTATTRFRIGWFFF